jgi:N-acetylglucosamine-6-sulfatase
MGVRFAGLSRTTWAASLSVVALVAASAIPSPAMPPDPRPNVILVVTDDQAFDTLPSDAMPWLTERLREPGWTLFPHAFASTPICCPARATLLTGRYSFHTGVRTNVDGPALDETQTLPVWLDNAGYTTALVGKYLNRYPYDRGPYVPRGWDRWYAKRNTELATTYRNFPVVEQGVPKTVLGAYATDVLAAQAASFVRTAPRDSPFFLVFAPSAPHQPWTPASRHAGALVTPAVPQRHIDVDRSPPWVRALPPIDALQADRLADARDLARESLLAVDEALRGIVNEVEARGQLERTIILVLTDNGFSFGEHRWVGKGCPYEACVRTPIAVHVPGSIGGVDETLVSNVDVAPSIAELTGTTIPDGFATDGIGLADVIRGETRPPRDGVLLTYAGDESVPGWWAVRTQRWKLITYADGFRELYDLARDPAELRNVAGDPERIDVVARLVGLFDAPSLGPSTERR